MYHNAGEYAILQLWGEVVAVLKGWGVGRERAAKILESWKTKQGGSHPNFLSSYMLDITVEVVKMADQVEAGGVCDGSALVDKALDMVGSKGTGLWSAQEAMGVGVPAPSLAMAVISRQMSMCRPERLANAKLLPVVAAPATITATDDMIEDLYWGVAFAIIASYAQMFQCLRVLDKEFEFGLNLPATIATFRAGCILQGYLLQPMTEAFEKDANLPNLLCAFPEEMTKYFPRYQRLMGQVAEKTTVATPVLSASLSYIQTMISTEIPSAQVVALQRDVFGRHGFKRIDKDGDFNAQWPDLQ